MRADEREIVKMFLEEVSRDRNNNLNFLRFIATVLVIICHAYPLSLGEDAIDILGRMTDGQIHLGGVAVCIFFFFSGFFLNRSVNKGYGACQFFKARCIRIFPALIVVVFFCAFILGSCISYYSPAEYFSNSQTYEYLLNSVFILKHNLPGVFESNIYNATVNGSLWTLPIEFVCYIGCYVAWKTDLTNEKVMKFTIPLFCVSYVFLYILLARSPLIQSALRPCGMFYCGMLFDTYRGKIRIRISYVLLCMGGLVAAAVLNVFDYGVILFLPHILIFLVFGTKRKLNWFAENYEISYTMYLCAWPIQQIIVMLFGGSMNPVANFLITIPLAMVVGYFLNIMVEKPVLKYFEVKSRGLKKNGKIL